MGKLTDSMQTWDSNLNAVASLQGHGHNSVIVVLCLITMLGTVKYNKLLHQLETPAKCTRDYIWGGEGMG